MSEHVVNLVAAGEYASAYIPWSDFRTTMDGFYGRLPGVLNIDLTADTASGAWHRWTEGHDLVLDVGRTLGAKGPGGALHQLGHIILTDLPTKAGIPIPLLSKDGLGDFLVQSAHIPKEMLNINGLDAIIGYLVIDEGTRDLLLAAHGGMQWSTGTFFDTFGEGTVEILVGWGFKKPLIIVAGLENILAGIFSLSDYVSHIPVGAFLTASLVGFMVGGTLGFGLSANKTYEERLQTGITSGLKAGGLSLIFQWSLVAGCGGVAVLAMTQFAKAIAQHQANQIAALYTLDDQGYRRLVMDFLSGDHDGEMERSLNVSPYLRLTMASQTILADNDTRIQFEPSLSLYSDEPRMAETQLPRMSFSDDCRLSSECATN